MGGCMRHASQPRGGLSSGDFLLVGNQDLRDHAGMKKVWLFTLLIAVVVGFSAYRYFTASAITIRLNQHEIDTILAKKFPLKKTHWKIVTITYSDPKATFVPESNQVRISVKASIITGIPPFEHKSEANTTVLTGLRYDAEAKTVMLHNAVCEDLQLPGIPEKYEQLTKEALNLTSVTCFEKIPIYELKARNRSQNIARMVLRDLKVDQDQLVFTLKLPE
jgi:hypothetical protein